MDGTGHCRAVPGQVAVLGCLTFPRHSKDPAMRYAAIVLSLLVATGACGVTGVEARESSGSAAAILRRTAADWSVDVVSDKLDYPWNINRTGDLIVLTEKAGNIVMIEDGRLKRYKLETSAPIVNEGGSGLLGMALSEHFGESGLAYLYHSYRGRSGLANKVIRARFDGGSWRETDVLVAEIPGHRLYNGGRIAIGPDGHLYVTTGWTENRELPQDLGSLAGKILRMTLDGRVPGDNPFRGSYVYSYGHRNPQGLAWNEAGELFVAEHGQSALDEINLVRPGANYGWPLISGDEKRDGMETPVLHSGDETWAPSGIAFAGTALLVTALQGRGLYVLDRAAGDLELVLTSDERYRDVLPVGEDLYVITTNRSPRRDGPSRDRLLRLSPKR
jgi:glucose/arabinose dehydrogenase